MKESDSVSYSIARVEKVKSGVNTTGIQRHVQRKNNTYNNKDIDHEKTAENYDLIHGQEKQNYKELIEKRIEEGYTGNRKIRSDAIKHVDGIITSDNEFFKDMDPDQVQNYFQDSLEFLENEYGKENMLYASVHLDESTPHMHFGVVPITEDGRLSAKEVVGNKKALTEFQDRYNQFINERGFQLERGESKQVTEKKHQDIDQYKQGTKYHETVFYQAQEKARQEESKLDELTATLEPKELKYESREVKTEVKNKLFGKSEVVENETGNVVLTPEQYSNVSEQVNAAAAIQKDYKRLKSTDLVQENERLQSENKWLENLVIDKNRKNDKLKAENKDLKQENRTLKEQYSDLKKNFAIVYGIAKQATKDRFEGLKSKMKQVAEKHNTATSFSKLEKEMDRPKKAKQKEHNMSL